MNKKQSETGLRGKDGRGRAGVLSNQGVLGCLHCTDFVELGGSHLEFSGHLTDRERPAAMHHHPVFTECPLGQDLVTIGNDTGLLVSQGPE